MAYINLLPPEDRREGMSVKRWLVFGGIMFYILILMGVYIFNLYQVKELRIEYASLEAQLLVLELTLQRIQTLEKERGELARRLQVGRSLDPEVGVSEQLIWLSQRLPTQVTLSRMSYGVGKLTFEGEATDYSSIATLIESIKDTEYFAGVELISSFTNPNPEHTIGFKIRAILQTKDEADVK